MRDNSSDDPCRRRPSGEKVGPSRKRQGARKGGSGRRAGPRPSGPIRLAQIGGNRFELIHPACVRETELDYEEGLEIWRAGDPEGARDALRYALGACRDNMWVHVGLGRIALEEFRDPSLARGHFGYAVDLGRRALPPQFAGLLPADRPTNRPFHDALDGLIRSLEALGRRGDCAAFRTLKERLSGGPGNDGPRASEKPDSRV
jgi:hypothetical protein